MIKIKGEYRQANNYFFDSGFLIQSQCLDTVKTVEINFKYLCVLLFLAFAPIMMLSFVFVSLNIGITFFLFWTFFFGPLKIRAYRT